MTTGPSTFLPLHAAGIYDKEGGPKLYDYAISSYTPTLSNICGKTPLRTDMSGFRGILAVAQSATPGANPLPGTIREVHEIQGQAGKLDAPVTVLNDQDGTVASVLEGIERHDWVHLACHGIQDQDSLRSSFLLHDDRLTLKTLMGTSFKNAEIAFLSACQTATGDVELPEEAIHLAAGMLMAGFRTVFATMWSIYDQDAPVVASEVYSYLLGELEKPSGRGIRPAYALHAAMRRLRARAGEKEFLRWVPYVHYGL